MSKNLVIVESPAKARTIQGFLGKEFVVKSCFGHIRDLNPNTLSVDIENGFKPIYEIPEDKKKIVNELAKASQNSDLVWLASDEDREGEAISWHLCEVLQLKEEKIRRIVFHEITKKAIKEAIENPRKININLVNAQQARRILDRLVGFEISPILWKKVKPNLSAGRVQSVAVRLIVEREREIQAFEAKPFYKVTADFILNNDKTKSFKAELDKKFDTLDEVYSFLEKCKNATFTIEDVEIKPSKKSPPPPFTTSTLQQEASRKLGFSVARTMMIAQQLYESGKITYMRTDSVNLSDLALSMCKKEIEQIFGKEYVKIRKYTTKTKGAQEAHEAIRPTYIDTKEIDGDTASKKLYDLIWKRTIASQMSDAQIEKTTITININNTQEKFIARGETILFDGFLKLYAESSEEETNNEEKENLLPKLKIGDKLQNEIILATEKYPSPPPRYSEASLVKKLEELGIGRPSTYAPTISTIQKRGYVVNESKEGITRNITVLTLKDGIITKKTKTEKTGAEKSKLFPTDIGIIVNDFLIEHFEKIIDYNFTAKIEEELDEIAQGKLVWNKMLANFYKYFHELVINSDKAKKISGERLLGKDPETGKNVYAKIGKYGPIIQIGDSDNHDKPKFAPLLKNQSIETITLEEALSLFKLPKKIGTYQNKEVTINNGPYGPYIKIGNEFCSIPKSEDIHNLTLERCIEIYEEKISQQNNKILKTFEENNNFQIIKGKWGIYLKANGKNYKLNHQIDINNITYKDCLEIIKETSNNTNTEKKAASLNKIIKPKTTKRTKK